MLRLHSIFPMLCVGTPSLALLRPGIDDAGASRIRLDALASGR